MRLATAALLAVILSMWSANSAAAPVSYQIQPDSFVSQCTAVPVPEPHAALLLSPSERYCERNTESQVQSL
jgi:hypothetical protein